MLRLIFYSLFVVKWECFLLRIVVVGLYIMFPNFCRGTVTIGFCYEFLNSDKSLLFRVLLGRVAVHI